MNRTPFRIFPALVAGALLAAGCGNGEVPRQPQAAQPSAETFEKFGDYELHFNGIRTDELLPEIAQAYGIERNSKRVLLIVAVLHRGSGSAIASPVEAAVTVAVRTLSSTARDVPVRRISEGTSVSYVGEVPIDGRQILVFDILATPAGESQRFAASFQREFFAE
jgi:propanediol dehydratase large subunit